jgi:SSS family solute:Na+ symporter
LTIYLGILIYIASTAAIVITGSADTAGHYIAWLAAFSIVSIIYSAIGGAWAVAIMDSVQFIIMLGGALIVLPIVMYAAGGMHGIAHALRASGRADHLSLVPSSGEFNWVFIAAYMLLGFKWSSVDQSILQRAFGARSPGISAKGMVLSAIITTPLAFFWVLPGMAASVLHPGFTNPDKAVPWLLATEIPVVARGLLGIVLCGLIAAQISAITADVNSVATLFTSDVYRSLRKKAPSQKQLLAVVRISSICSGILMLLVAWYLRTYGEGALRANYTITGILDMPLFVVTIVYGLLWKRVNWQGAAAGFLLGGLCGIFTHFLITTEYFNSYLFPALSVFSTSLAHYAAHINHYFGPYQKQVRNIVAIVSTAAALIITPVVSLLTKPDRHQKIWNTMEADESNESAYHVIPHSALGKASLALVIIGFAIFVIGIVSAHWQASVATPFAIGGMLAVFAGGVGRLATD